LITHYFEVHDDVKGANWNVFLAKYGENMLSDDLYDEEVEGLYKDFNNEPEVI